ncbi:MAG: T9SS type A sorting domain-containing protein, partial [Flavobacteriales bacterium]|nr:T9SS type A sorting domain-containing protein [Flavobacteriales bacterium]
ITGSHNWSNSAESFNDENTLIIHDERIANIYYQEFMAIYSTFVGIGIEEKAESALVYPNPTDRYLNIQLQNMESGTSYLIVDMNGRRVDEGQLRTGSLNILDLSHLIHGYYSIYFPEQGWSKTFIKR